MTYEGITADSLFLLAENRFQNSKSYYEEHKPAIRQGVIEPLRHLAADLAPAVLAIDPLLVVDPMKNGCVSRVRRDTRFTLDKCLYRENVWVAFLRDKRAWDYCLPAFYVDFSIQRVEYGVGFYSAEPAVMQLLRRHAQEQPQVFLKALRRAQRAGFPLSGQPYARPRSTEETPALLRPLYDCRNVELSRTAGPEMMADPALPERLAAEFEALAPIYRLLIAAVEEHHRLKG